MNKKRGFTIIELLAVVAIIAVLSSVVITSMSGARARGRDAKRIADIKNIELALKLYAVDHNSQYPAQDSWQTALVPNYLPSVPQDPLAPARRYIYTPTGTFGSIHGFYLGALLETEHSALVDDADFSGSGAAPGATTFNGRSAGSGNPLTCGTDNAGTGERCYDVRN